MDLLSSFKDISIHLFQYLACIFLLLYFFSKTKVFRNTMLKVKTTLKQKIFLIVIFGGISISGTYFGFPVENAIANTRAIGIIAAGLIAGPFVGVGVGLMAGLHRYFLGGLTINAAFISAVLQGYLAGLINKRITHGRRVLIQSFFVAVALETVHMLIVIAITSPLPDAIELVELIGPPMIIINSIGVLFIIAILENVYSEQVRTQGNAAELALEIANRTLPYLKKGLNERSAKKAAEIINTMAGDFDLVCFTSRDTMLSRLRNDDIEGFGAIDFIHSENIKKCLQTGEIISFSANSINRRENGDGLSSIIIPLKIEKSVVGTLALFKHSGKSLTAFEIKLSKGLAQLISTQLEISKVQYASHILAQAEIKALQAQINPHFLFNALNTIVYYCIKDPGTAKDLIIHLSDFYRKNLANFKNMVDLETEIQHIKSYAMIEMARFKGKLEIEYRIDPGFTCTLPPLILQPIVENSIKHGILPRKGGGKIIVSAYQDDGARVLCVEDNGIGMSEETVKELFHSEETGDNIGLRNVKSRLHTIFGENCRFTIESEVDRGTKVYIQIPFMN